MNEIKLTYKGQDYILGFTRQTAAMVEQRGVTLEDITEKPLTTWELLFAGAFLKNHRDVPKALIDEIYANTKDIKGLIAVLSDLFAKPYMDLVDPDAEKEALKNGQWETV